MTPSSGATTVSSPPGPRVRHSGTRRPRWLILLGVLVLLLIVLVLVWDWNWFKPMIERRVEAATNRSFAINGDLDVDLGFPTVVRADGIRLSNADWSTQGDEMLAARRVEIAIRVWPLLSGRIDLPIVRVDHGHVLLERDTEGRANWQFTDEPSEPPDAPP